MKKDRVVACLALALLLAGMSVAGRFAAEEDADRADRPIVVYVRPPGEAEREFLLALEREQLQAARVRHATARERRAWRERP